MSAKPNLDHITPQLRPLAVPVDSLVLDPKNAREHDERSLENLAAVLKEYKQRKPIVVRKDGMVIKAGNGTLMAARRLGWSHVAAVVVDEDEKSASGYAIADNRTAELSSWNYDQLTENLADLLQDDGSLAIPTAWSPEEVAQLLNADWSPPASTGPLPQTGQGGGEGGASASDAHVIQLSPEQWEKYARVVEALKEVGALPEDATDGACVEFLATRWERE
jgi:hypothetical protein